MARWGILSLILSIGSVSALPAALDGSLPAECSGDSCISTLLASPYTAYASLYCSNYPPVTVTVATATITRSGSPLTRTAATQPPRMARDASVDQSLGTTTSSATSQPTDTATTTPAPTHKPKLVERQQQISAQLADPPCLKDADTDRIASACSCIGVPLLSIGVTKTVAVRLVTKTLTRAATAA